MSDMSDMIVMKQCESCVGTKYCNAKTDDPCESRMTAETVQSLIAAREDSNEPCDVMDEITLNWLRSLISPDECKRPLRV